MGSAVFGSRDAAVDRVVGGRNQLQLVPPRARAAKIFLAFFLAHRPVAPGFCDSFDVGTIQCVFQHHEV